MREYAKIHKLDTKQRTTFEVICCTFVLYSIERISLHYDLGIISSSGKERHKKTRKLPSTALKLTSKEDIAKLVKELKKKVGKSHLLMFLSEPE